MKSSRNIRKLNLIGRVITIIMGVVFIIAALNKNLPLMLASAFFRNMAGGPLTGTLHALVAETSDYTYRTQKTRIDGVMFSCSSIGVKLGGGIGSAILGWMLAFSGFDGTAAVQSASAINVIFILYAVTPVIFGLIFMGLIYLLKVEKANRDWDETHTEGEAA